MSEATLKKVFVLSGEVSGDRIAAWFLKRQNVNPSSVLAIGGDDLEAYGASLVMRCEDIAAVGIVEIIRRLPFFLRLFFSIAKDILSRDIEHVILVDYPGFNLRLARYLKSKKPGLKITYVSPPQLWCWGAWKLPLLAKYTDDIVVMYPFEVAWYAQRGVKVRFLGNPVFDALDGYVNTKKDQIIALLPGSRSSEVYGLAPIFVETAFMMQQRNSNLNFVIPTLPKYEAYYQHLVSEKNLKHVLIISDPTKKYALLSSCCAALAKPGTITLELAFLRVPTIIAFTTSSINYFLAKMFVSVSWMGLPNLLLKRIIFKEFIQHNVTPLVLSAHMTELLNGYKVSGEQYRKIVASCDQVRALFVQHDQQNIQDNI